MIGRIQKLIHRSLETGRWLVRVGGDLTANRGAPSTVAVDVNAFWENLTGVGWYLYRILEELRDRDDVQIRLYGPTMFVDPHDAQPVVALPEGRAVEVVSWVVPHDLLLSRGLLIRILRRLEPWLIAIAGDQVLFAPNFVLPGKFRRARGRLVMTIHDRAVRSFPWTLSEGTLEALEGHLERSIDRATAIITVSETVRQELIEAGEADGGRITAIHHGPGHLVEPPRQSTGASSNAYCLHVGTIEPRKNLGMLVEVWRRLHAARPDAPRLILCGGVGWKSEELEELLEKAQDQGWLMHAGYVGDDELAVLYRDALALVFPSLYEGFGLPLIEGMAMGIPAVCSDIPVFREVAGDAALFAPPTDQEAWLAQLDRILSDRDLHREYSTRARKRAQDFHWGRAASSTLSVWQKVGAPEADYRGSA